MSISLPERPDLDQLRRQAKELRDAARSGDPVAAERLARHHPSASPGVVTLAVAQLVIARELGFANWSPDHSSLGSLTRLALRRRTPPK
jgi:hypothetical protein